MPSGRAEGKLCQAARATVSQNLRSASEFFSTWSAQHTENWHTDKALLCPEGAEGTWPVPPGSLLLCSTSMPGTVLRAWFRACLGLQEACSLSGETAGPRVEEQRQGKAEGGVAVSHWASSVHARSAAPRCWEEAAPWRGCC